MRTKLTLFLSLFLSVLMLPFTSCGEENGETGEIDSTAYIETELDDTAQTFYTVPSPNQMMRIIDESGIPYMENLLNSPDARAQYSTTPKMAMNIGVYTADLGYAIIYNQNQKIIRYYEAVNDLSEKVGIASTFDEAKKKRVEANLGNQDSLLAIAGQSEADVQTYLNDNESHASKMLMTAGGWVESHYIATQMLKKKTDEALRQRVGEGKLALHNIIRMMENVQDQGEYAEILTKLKELHTIYDQVNITYSYEQAEPDTTGEVMVFENKSEVEMSDELLGQITEKIAEIRKYITG